jgi:predicted metal-dependent HD superfamily phosphohydrolase
MPRPGSRVRGIQASRHTDPSREPRVAAAARLATALGDDVLVPDDGRVQDLERDWSITLRAAGATADERDVTLAGAQLLDRWRQPDRHYHDVEHLTEVLAAVDALAELAADPVAVRLAAWFHDAVYDRRPGDDEEASAVLAGQVLTRLGVPQGRVTQVIRLVRLTVRHDPVPDDPDGLVLCDADLAILAAPAPRYARYVAAVRQEYAHVPDEAFQAGRAEVLDRLAAGPLFRTPPGRRRWEDAARANLAAELESLSMGPRASEQAPGRVPGKTVVTPLATPFAKRPIVADENAAGRRPGASQLRHGGRSTGPNAPRG